ncbi:hypothetical protein T484DRAFT_1621562, partial [Baffinella frigidus]
HPLARATRDPQPSTLNPQPSTLNPQPSTLNSQPSPFDPQPSTLNPQPSTLNPQPSTLNSQPSTLNPQPSTLNPGRAAGWAPSRAGNARTDGAGGVRETSCAGSQGRCLDWEARPERPLGGGERSRTPSTCLSRRAGAPCEDQALGERTPHHSHREKLGLLPSQPHRRNTT